MTINVTLNSISNLQDTTTAQTQLNNNNTAISGGFTTALNVTGDQMKGNLDMNSNQILNLPAPAGANSPARLVDIISASTAITVPPIGTSGAVVGLLNANNTFSGTTTFSTIAGNVNFTGTGITLPTAVARTRLQTNTTYYVNSSTGSDTNNGLSATSAFQTIQHAVVYVGNNLDLAGTNVTIQLADGTYNENVAFPPYYGRAGQGHTGPVLIQGDVNTPANVVINSTTFCFTAVETGGFEYDLSGMTLQGAGGIVSDKGSWVVIGPSMVFGAMSTSAHMIAENDGFIEILNNYTITGSAPLHLFALNRGYILINTGVTVTVSNTPNFSIYFVDVDIGGLIAAVSVTFTGSATGTRWYQGRNALLWTGGSNPNTYFPGNANGTSVLLNEGTSVSTGQVIISGGVNGLPVWSASPTLTSLTSSSITVVAGGPSIYSGTGAPTTSVSQGSIFMRSDGTGTNSRMYVYSATGWVAITTGA